MLDQWLRMGVAVLLPDLTRKGIKVNSQGERGLGPRASPEGTQEPEIQGEFPEQLEWGSLDWETTPQSPGQRCPTPVKMTGAMRGDY